MTEAPGKYPIHQDFGITVVFGRTKPDPEAYDPIDPIVEVLVDVGMIADERQVDWQRELHDSVAGEGYVVTIASIE
jgi:hypothetical protein